MLQDCDVMTDGLPVAFHPDVSSTTDLTLSLQFWMAYVARDLLRLGVYFRGVGVMCEIPGGARYRPLSYDDANPNGLPEHDSPWYWLHGAQRETVLNVLAECLRRLDAPSVMKRVPGARLHRPQKLSDKWMAYLDRHAALEHGLLNVIAQCVDELIVRPAMAKIDALPATTWWQRWWSQME